MNDIFSNKALHLIKSNFFQGSLGILKVTGYLRGQSLSVNSLVHIPGWGDFQMSQIDAPNDQHPLELGRKGQSKDGNVNDRMDDERVLERANPAKQVKQKRIFFFQDSF